ncbi:uncharacterized protein LOC114575621 [Exaiptasia diaphana]|uniref:Immunoglobulin domain-containing protein n=1 Tax=Exaiptasia diaphana TaxID=2652724 RepID=A0A913YMI7_EXADI|nr:uncharacterized protein LOC114575621 [Exaiptasia diaphana]
MTRGLHAGMYSCLVLFLLVKSSDAAVRFTKQPGSKLYVLKGHTAKFTWDYHVDNINIEFDSQSPRWYYHNDSYVIGYGDAFLNWKFIIDTSTCPARLLTPTIRVSVEGKATLVITNVTLADSGTYGCRLVLSSGLPISMPTSQAQLIVEVARFTNVPANKLYVVKGETAKFTWEYHVDNINTEFDSRSPRWYFHSLSSMIGYADAFDGRKFRIDRTCPARLRTPTVRVSVEDKATLVIKNVTMVDSGTYGCLLFLLSGYLHSMPTSEVELIVTGK